MNLDDTEQEKRYIHNMFVKENRLKSFKDWVFDSCACTPEKVNFSFLLQL